MSICEYVAFMLYKQNIVCLMGIVNDDINGDCLLIGHYIYNLCYIGKSKCLPRKLPLYELLI